MASRNEGIPWPVWAIVTILVAIIGAYATIEVKKINQSDDLENREPSLRCKELRDVLRQRQSDLDQAKRGPMGRSLDEQEALVQSIKKELRNLKEQIGEACDGR